MATVNTTPGDLELGPRDKGRVGKPIELPILENFGLDSQIGPTFIGFWNLTAFITGGMFFFIWLVVMASQVGWNPIAFAKYFFVLQIDPPPAAFGLGWAPLEQGGWWLISTFFLTISIFAWLMHLYTRAVRLGLKPYLAMASPGRLFSTW